MRHIHVSHPPPGRFALIGTRGSPRLLGRGVTNAAVLLATGRQAWSPVLSTLLRPSGTGLSRVWLVGVVTFLMLTGCGGGGNKTSTTAAAATTANTASTSTSSITSHVLTNNELNGFKAAQPSVDHTVSAWLADNLDPAVPLASETKRLTRLGFVAGATEHLTGPDRRDGLSVVEQFKTPAGARLELANELKTLKATVPGYDPFAVPGIPGAFGYAAEGPGLNIGFAFGNYYYLVGEFVSTVSASSKATLTAAANRLYRRVHG
jgi:hypothetical protein